MPASVTRSAPDRNSPVIDRMDPRDRLAPGILVSTGGSSSRSGDHSSPGGGATDVGGVNSSNPGSQGGEGWSLQNGNSEGNNDGDRERVNGGRTRRRTRISRTRGQQTQLHQARMRMLLFNQVRSNERPLLNMVESETFASYPAYISPADFRVGGRSRVAQFGAGGDDDMDHDIDLDSVDPPPAAEDEVAAWHRTRMAGSGWSSVSFDVAGVDQNPAATPGNYLVNMSDDTEEEWYSMQRGEQAMYRRLASYGQYVDYPRSQQRR